MILNIYFLRTFISTYYTKSPTSSVLCIFDTGFYTGYKWCPVDWLTVPKEKSLLIWWMIKLYLSVAIQFFCVVFFPHYISVFLKTMFSLSEWKIFNLKLLTLIYSSISILSSCNVIFKFVLKLPYLQ